MRGHGCSLLLADCLSLPQVSAALREGRPVEPESVDCVTIFFSDIVGFEAMSVELPPQEVITITWKNLCDDVHVVRIR